MSVTLKLSDQDAKAIAEALRSCGAIFSEKPAEQVVGQFRRLTNMGYQQADMLRLSAAFQTAYEANQR